MTKEKFIDISHTIEDGLITYQGFPAPVIGDYLSREESRKRYAKGVEFQIGKIEMVANTGTYVDSPFHRYANGKDLSQLPLSSIANLPGLVFRVNGERQKSIDVDLFRGVDLAGSAVLVHTGWDVHWATEQYFKGHPFLTKNAAMYLIESKATLVGIDSLNIDSTDDPERPVHSGLLAAGIPIVEHLCNLRSLPDRGFRFFAVPVKVKSFGSFPVRAFGIVE